MANKYVLDAHAVIWHLEANSRLSRTAKSILADPASDLVLPAITLAEAVYVVEKGRTRIPSAQALLDGVLADPRIDVYPLNLDVLLASVAAKAVPELHDRLLVSTALLLQSSGHVVSLVTKDQSIVHSGLVAVTW
jgi:PIN domain nuclease of toxin-antitoxin system